MALVTPTWFRQRQATAEPAGESTYRLFGPNLPDWFVSVRRAENGKWQATLRREADGPEVAASAPGFEHEYEAWEAAFELYRGLVIV